MIVVRLVSDEMRQVFTDPLVVLERIRYKDRFRLVAQDLLDLLAETRTQGRWRIGYAEHARACKSVRVLLSSFRVLRGAALPRAVELSPDGMGPVRIGVTA